MKFPTQRATERVIADIGSIARALKANAPPRLGSPVSDAAQLEAIKALPVIPDPTLEGAVIDSKLAQPVGPTPPIGETADPGGTLAGRPLLDTMLMPGR